MPVISNYQRYAGVCARLAGFGQDSFILDNRALNSDFVEINPNNSDIPAQTNELTAGSPSFYNQYLLSSLDWAGGSTASNISVGLIQCMLPDVSQENGTGNYSIIDPFNPDISYVQTNNNYNRRIYEVNTKDGSLTGRSTDTVYGGESVIIDITEKYVVLLGSYYNTNSYIYRLDKATFTLASLQFATTMYPQLLAKKDNYYFFYDTTSIKYVDISQTSLAWVELGKVADMASANLDDNSTYGVGSYFTPKMKNGWQYKIADYWVTVASKKLSLVGVNIDTANMQYDFTQFSDTNKQITIEYLAACDPNVIDMAKLYEQFSSYYYRSGRFDAFKIDDTKFGVLFTINIPKTVSYKTLQDAAKKSAYMIFETTGDPLKLKMLNAQFLDYPYCARPLFVDGKLILHIEGTATHMFKYNDLTKTLELVWNVKTPNLTWATYYNGLYWWVNGSTNVLSYEVQENYYSIKDSLDKTTFNLESTSKPQSTTYKVEVFNSDGERIRAKVKVDLTGVIQFSDGTKSKTITTSTDAPVSETIQVVNSGKGYTNATILLDSVGGGA
ncbi:hypothetical protein DAG40_07535 [Campylobacter coli]|nr:hypothetical protein [Campylobacter coli]